MNESVLIVADFMPSTLNGYQQIDLQTFDIVDLYKKCKQVDQVINYLLLVEDPKATLKEIKKQVKVIHAAGGLVKNGEGKLLFIYRLGKWDLPKGKVDPGEKSRTTAVREVQEECGIKVDYLGEKIMSSYHIYEMKGIIVLKRTKWYEMAVNNTPKLVPQISEDITQAKWLRKDDLAKVLKNTYRLIGDVLVKTGYV
ncbi:NUDIX hydrolase [Olivibacter domesticus]|uniref:ADP-ribose pyrophosphatase YjhB, NUDIX family n=1 Tax=Olivibacter domesticus TaxID=407022 RepID=A0A1H7PFL9_OLID1|nr:NUDIX domain-containing protein [Olivibacter domesticus]SEL34562.1 ADP-ribose pyrophosphatase YjhB, NUDIX family [Olivibacter domesticus]